MSNDEEKFEGRMHGPQFDPETKDSLGVRLIFMLIIAFMLSLAQSVLFALALIQFILMLLNKGDPNPRLADLGESLGIWIAKSARYLTAASDVKPWPWTELD